LKLLLDQGLPRSTVERLSLRGIEAVHTADIGLASAPDAAILASAREADRVVVTLDADFHSLLVRSGEGAPSVIRLRIDRATAELVADLVVMVLERCQDDLEGGAMVSTDGVRVRVRRLRAAR
jgi:predicted nuclease of predicted toxin-antitoxin system